MTYLCAFNMDNKKEHKAGFVNIIGLPNVGKSSLINNLIEANLSIVNSKSQTTRQNIKGFINHPDYQIILVDTPGFIEKPAYQLQENMNFCIDLAFEESDILIFVVDKYFTYPANHPLIENINKSKAQKILVINKMDLYKIEEVDRMTTHYKSILNDIDIVYTSALKDEGKEAILSKVIELLPVSPPFYDKEEWTDRDTRFFCSEIIRERIFSTYQKEIPYSCEVVIEKFSEQEDNIVIEAVIYVERESQKSIIIGHKAEKLKKISIESKEQIAKFLEKKIHLYTFVKVLENWRNKETILNRLGYISKNKA